MDEEPREGWDRVEKKIPRPIRNSVLFTALFA